MKGNAARDAVLHLRTVEDELVGVGVFIVVRHQLPDQPYLDHQRVPWIHVSVGKKQTGLVLPWLTRGGWGERKGKGGRERGGREREIEGEREEEEWEREGERESPLASSLWARGKQVWFYLG